MAFEAKFEQKVLGFFDTERQAWEAMLEEYGESVDMYYTWNDHELNMINEATEVLESLIDEPVSDEFYLPQPQEYEDFIATVVVSVQPEL